MKNKKGFTLIELLAVIVILAIIALIAVPIILGIINDSKNSADKRSIELYGKAVENAIANYLLTNNKDENITLEKIESYIKYNGSKVECEITNLKKDGTVYLEGCKVGGEKVDYTYGKKEEVKKIGKAVTDTNKTLAGKIPQGNFEAGDEYIINVDGIHEYHFYVLGTDGEKVSLIMSNNICDDGTLAKEENECLVFWATGDDYKSAAGTGEYGLAGSNSKGPITVMNYLHVATKNWNNISDIQMNYRDEVSADNSGYGGITTKESTTKIIMKDGTVTASYENLKARLPKYSEILGTGCTSDLGSCPAWMVNGLEAIFDYEFYPKGTKEDINGIEGYWSISSDDSYVYALDPYIGSAKVVSLAGYSGSDAISGAYSGDGEHFSGYQYHNGVRPVIEVLKSDFS